MTAAPVVTTDGRNLSQLERYPANAAMNPGECLVDRWLRQAGYMPEHEAHFARFWTDKQNRAHGFRLDFTFNLVSSGRPILAAVEVCEAGRYPSIEHLPTGTNASKWRPPEVKLRDKRDKIAKLWELFELPCALVTEVEIDTWKMMTRSGRRQAIIIYLSTAFEALKLPRPKAA